MSKPPKKGFGPEFSREREFKVLLEDLQSQFRVFGDGMEDVRANLTEVRDRTERIEGKVEHLGIEMSFVRKVLPTVATKDDLKQLEKRLNALETTR